MTKKRAILFGPLIDPKSKKWIELVKSLKLTSKDYLVGVDLGVYQAKALGLKLDGAVGDWDGLSQKLKNVDLFLAHISNVDTYLPQKDQSDFALSLKHVLAVSNNWSEVIAVGFLGGRLDHHQAVIQELHRFIQKQKLKSTLCLLLSPELKVFALSSQSVNKLQLTNVKKGQIISVFPLSSKVAGVRLKGMKYPLNQETLQMGSTGLSNEVTNAKQCEISFISGQLLVMVNQ